jgi:hypothetical protein
MATATKKAAPRKRTAKKAAPAPKKLPPRKPAAKKSAPAKRTPAKKAAAKAPAKKVTAKATPRKRTAQKVAAKPQTNGKRPPYGELDEHGFRPGSDSAIIVAAMIEGGLTRNDVARKALDRLPSVSTRGENEKNVPSLISALLKRLKAKGYTEEAHWRLVPPPSANGKRPSTTAVKSPAKRRVVRRHPQKA